MRPLSLYLASFKKFLKYRHIRLSSYGVAICFCVSGSNHVDIWVCVGFTGHIKKLFVIMSRVKFKLCRSMCIKLYRLTIT